MHAIRTLLATSVALALVGCSSYSDSTMASLVGGRYWLKFVDAPEGGVQTVQLCQSMWDCNTAPDGSYKTARGTNVRVRLGVIRPEGMPKKTCRFAVHENTESIDCKDHS